MATRDAAERIEKTMTWRRTAEERIAKRSAKAQPSDYGVGASAISIASAGRLSSRSDLFSLELRLRLMQGAATIAPPICGRLESVEWECGAVALGRACLLPPLSSGGALAFPFMRGLRGSCWGGCDCVAPSPDALARSAYCRMPERPIRRIAEPYAKLESTADPRLAKPYP
jgi:hypothetical protein